jgi:hypothetical protein
MGRARGSVVYRDFSHVIFVDLRCGGCVTMVLLWGRCLAIDVWGNRCCKLSLLDFAHRDYDDVRRIFLALFDLHVAMRSPTVSSDVFRCRGGHCRW